MLAGETASLNGVQYALFPLPYVRVTQESSPGSYSHCCGHPADYGFPYDPYPYYAPCDCHRIWTYPSNGQSLYTSDAPVITPSGTHYISFLFAHDNNIPAQTHFNQGDLIGHSGNAASGGIILPHVHLDQSLYADDPLVSYGIYCPGYGNLCYALKHSEYASLVFYLTGNETVVDTGSMTFDTVPSEPPEPPGPPAPTGSQAVKLLLLYKGVNNRRSNNGRRKRNTVLL